MNNRKETTATKSQARQLDPTAEKIFRTLIADGPKIIGEEDSGFMRVHVEKIGTNRWSVAHYFTQNGDKCCDPDMVFDVAGGEVVPVYFQQAIPPVFTESSEGPAQLGSLVTFANQWMRNIADQQTIIL